MRVPFTRPFCLGADNATLLDGWDKPPATRPACLPQQPHGQRLVRSWMEVYR